MPTTTPDPATRAFGLGKLRGMRLHADQGPLPTSDPRPRDQLRTALAELITRTALGRPAGRDVLDELRRLAVHNATDDWDGTALATVGYLADRYLDPPARAWLPIMLAGAGRYQDAIDLEPSWAPGRPAADAYVLLVTAYAFLGEDRAAAGFLDLLGARFPGLRNDFVSIWDDTALGRRLAGLMARNSAGGPLSVFYHLPFCGGTSMISSLKKTLPWAANIEVGRRFGLYQIELAQGLPAERTRQARLVHLHHPFPIKIAGRELSYFTVLRDPVSQLSSGFYKRRAAAHIVATRDTGSATFAEHADYTIRNGLTNMLARQLVVLHPDLEPAYRDHYRGPGSYLTAGAEEDMFWFSATGGLSEAELLRLARETLDERFHLVGTMDHLAAAHLAGAAGAGLPVVRRLVHQGKSGQPKDGPGQRTESRLRLANDVDQTLYEEYAERFERDYAGLISDVVDGSVGGAAQTESVEQLGDGVAAVK